VKNEYPYFLSQAKDYKHTEHVHFFDVPFLCSQSMILSSNTVDFMQAEYKYHHVDLLLSNDLAMSNRYRVVEDYQRNADFFKHCTYSEEPHVEPTEQTTSPGILMIVEADNAAEKLSPLESVNKKLQQALQKVGLTVVSTADIASEDNGDAITIFLKEGHVTARIWPDLHYCAFDIHLWSSFEKHDAVKQALVGAVGSNVASSYRIVAGGMFGVSTWKDDLRNRGPGDLTELCDSPIEAVRDNMVDQTYVDSALEKIVRLVPHGSNNTIAVLCGKQEQPCASVDLLEKMGSKVIPLWTCPSLYDGVEYAKGGTDLMFACETEMFKLFTGMGTKVDTIMVDSSAPFAMAQIVYRIFSSQRHAGRFLSTKLVVLAVLVDREAWRSTLVDQFRKTIFPDSQVDSPVFTAELLFNTTESSFGLALFSRGNEDFVEGVVGLVQDVESSTGLAPEIRKLRAGNPLFQGSDWDPRIYGHDDYDQSSGLEQWMSQKPLGFQSVLQFEMQNKEAQPLSVQRIKDAISQTFSVSVEVHENAVFHNKEVGDGCIVAILWDKGTVVAFGMGRPTWT
jgi:S-adenosylmethionine/arginine decarboxylase-like enzyme